MTESLLQAQNNELRERLRDLVDVGKRNLEMSDQIAARIKENHRLVDTIFEKQAIIDDLNNSIDCLVKKISNLIPINHTIDELEKTK